MSRPGTPGGRRPACAFHDLPAEAFPFTVEYLDDDSGELLLTQTASGPGVLKGPSLRPSPRFAVRLTFADGGTIFVRPDAT